MSPASKSKDKSEATKGVKEQPHVSSKPSPLPSNSGNGAPASAYNPVLGTFPMLETTASSVFAPSMLQNNGRFGTIDDTEERSSSSLGIAAEYDSMSNNDSCSGESEDHQKEKVITSDSIPLPGSETDKRDKIRQKNEKKHQRQREKRAQELHERCSGYLMSRKLEVLAQQLVVMGFPSDRASMALILNEGRMEESVAWLLQESGEENKEQVAPNLEAGEVQLKIDIVDELARIADMEVKYKCTKQEVERAVVSCEGDLEKAEDALKTQKQLLAAATSPPKLGEFRDPSGLVNSKQATSLQKSPIVRSQAKGVASLSVRLEQRDDQDTSYTKQMAEAMLQQSANRNLQLLSRTQQNADWQRSQVEASSLEKRWLVTNSTPPSISYSAPPLHFAVSPAKLDPHYGIMGAEVNQMNLQTGGVLRDPVIMMQRPQSMNAKQSRSSTSIAGPLASTGWYSNGISNMEMMAANGGLGDNFAHLAFNGSSIPHQFYPKDHFQPYVSTPVEAGATGWGGSWNMTGTSPPSSSSLATPSSLGLFTGFGLSGSSSGSSSPVDWSNGGSLPQRDYTDIDWSLDLTPLRPSIKRDQLSSDTWSTMMFMGRKSGKPIMNGGVYMRELQDGINSGLMVGTSEWTSPFAGRDLFRVPRQFVTSPSL